MACTTPDSHLVHPLRGLRSRRPRLGRSKRADRVLAERLPARAAPKAEVALGFDNSTPSRRLGCRLCQRPPRRRAPGLPRPIACQARAGHRHRRPLLRRSLCDKLCTHLQIQSLLPQSAPQRCRASGPSMELPWWQRCFFRGFTRLCVLRTDVHRHQRWQPRWPRLVNLRRSQGSWQWSG